MSQHHEAGPDERAALAREGTRREQSGEQRRSTYRIKHFQDGWHAIRTQVWFTDRFTVTTHMFPFRSKEDAERWIAEHTEASPDAEG